MSRRSSGKSSGNVASEVQALLRRARNNKLSQSDLNELTKKYGNKDVAQQIQNMFISKFEKISKRANKFAQIIANKYAAKSVPYHQLLDKAIKYKQQYNLTEDEFALFRRIYELELRGERREEVFTPVTNLSKVLGAPDMNMSGSSEFNVSDKEYKHLQEILKVDAESRNTHRNIFLQSLTYTDCDTLAMDNSKFQPELGHQLTSYIHPVISALFTPKIDMIESRFLHSNIAALIASRYNKKSIGSRSNFELLHDLRVDPNDIVCDNNSPMLDLLNRSKLQVALWNNVLNLRNGQVYKSSSVDLVSAIDMCRMNKNDTPDLMYGRNDATVIKRLISAFSFRPTIIVSMPMQQNSNPFSAYSVNVRPTVNSISMINLRLPESEAKNGTFSVESAVKEQNQIVILHNGQFQYTRSKIAYSRGVIMFYIDRRVNYIKLSDYKPFSLDRLPKAMIGLEKVKDTSIKYDPNISVADEQFKLKSALCAVTSKDVTASKTVNYLLGSSAVLVTDAQSYEYNPLKLDRSHPIPLPFFKLNPDQVKAAIMDYAYVLIYKKSGADKDPSEIFA